MNHFQTPIATVDVVLFTIINSKLHVLLMNRTNPDTPFFNCLSFPGGFVHIDDSGSTEDFDLDATARRVIFEKTGINSDGLYLEQLKTFSGRSRDPRGWSISQTYSAIIPTHLSSQVSTDCVWTLASDVANHSLAFDHNAIYQYASSRLLNKTNYSILPAFFLGESFTLTELQKTYEIVLSTKLDKSSFRKRVESLNAFEPIGASRLGKQRPAVLYRLKAQDFSYFRSNIL